MKPNPPTSTVGENQKGDIFTKEPLFSRASFMRPKGNAISSDFTAVSSASQQPAPDWRPPVAFDEFSMLVSTPPIPVTDEDEDELMEEDEQATNQFSARAVLLAVCWKCKVFRAGKA